ncbi:MAG TPA: HD domain-containing phosphohydrolase, partial [Elusimicrobiales bacterium]|nr:HD domain-containing phosphohydrolase [Elusimicrobiales bacterium]
VRYALLSLLCDDKAAFRPVQQAAESLTTMLDSGNQSIVAMASKHYMPSNTSRHSVNVAIYSVFLCELLNIKKEDRVFVACAALLHDLGMQKYERIINKPDKFTPAERNMIQRHPLDASKIIESLEGMDKETARSLASVVSEVYEKYDGSGYPFRKQGEAISQYAQIISIANVYEALTHSRSWRKEMNQHDALKIMLDHAGNAFSKKIVRLLIDGLSMYPPGTLVKLSTGDTARVIAVNPTLISQPKLEIVSQRGGNRFLNLATEKGILITNVVSRNPQDDI